MNQLLGCLLTCGCLGISLLMAMPSVAQTIVESDKGIATVSLIKNLQADFESSDPENTVIVAETEVTDSSNTAEVVTSEASIRRPLPCRIFPAASMQQ